MAILNSPVISSALFSGNSIELDWGAVSGATGYKVTRYIYEYSSVSETEEIIDTFVSGTITDLFFNELNVYALGYRYEYLIVALAASPADNSEPSIVSVIPTLGLTQSEWPFPDYKIRRDIFFTPFEFLPDSETHYAVKMMAEQKAGKIKSDLSDVKVIYSENDTALWKVPFYTVTDLSDSTSFVFRPTLRTLDETANKVYSLYFNNKMEVVFPLSEERIYEDQLDLIDYPSLPNSRTSFTKPTLHWNSGASNVPGAKGVFTFTGHSSILKFNTGTNCGIVKYSINNTESMELDLYSDLASEVDLAISDEKVEVKKIRFEVSNHKNAKSSDYLVHLKQVRYHQVLLGELGIEKYATPVSQTFLVGQ